MLVDCNCDEEQSVAVDIVVVVVEELRRPEWPHHSLVIADVDIDVVVFLYPSKPKQRLIHPSSS